MRCRLKVLTDDDDRQRRRQMTTTMDNSYSISSPKHSALVSYQTVFKLFTKISNADADATLVLTPTQVLLELSFG